MKTNTTLKIIALCVICAATLMSGCMESDDTKSTVLFDVDLVLTRHVGTGVMDVNLNEDGSATIVRITGTSDDIVETGEWEIYRTTSDGTLYDINTDDTELRIKMEDGGHAIANIYENGFKKCGESFYGTWEQMMEETTDDEPTTEDEPTSAITSNVIDSIAEDSTESLTNSHLGNLPVTAMVDHPNAGMVQITLEKDGSAEVCTPEYDGNCDSGKWVLVEETSTSVSYDVTDCVGADFVITLFNNGYATGDNMGVKLKGSWEKGIEGSEGGSSTQDSSYKPASATDVSDMPDLPVTVSVVVDPVAFGYPSSSYVIEVILHANGAAELCTIGLGDDWDSMCIWERSQSTTSHVYDITKCMGVDFAVTLLKDGEAIGQMEDFQLEGSWEPGTKGAYTLSPSESDPEYKIIHWHISASYFEFDEDGRFTGNMDGHSNDVDMLYTDKAWADGRPTTVEDILDEMGVHYDKIVVTSEETTYPTDLKHEVEGRYVVTGDQFGSIKLTANWVGTIY